jgi:hypothetical protein
MKTPLIAIFIALIAGSIEYANSTIEVRSSNLPVTEIDAPAGQGSAEPNLSVGSGGEVYLSWLEPIQPKGHALKFAVRMKNGRWSEARPITQGDNWFVNWADFPSILALPNGALAAHWLAKSGPGTYAYNVNLSISRDGRSWSKPIVPHRDGTQTEHGFVSMLPVNGRISAVWLDGRKMKGADHGGAGHGSEADEMSLMHTTIALDGTLGPETLLDGRVCECCQTSAAATPSGMAVVYRDRSDNEVRDISIVRMKNGGWLKPQPLSKDNWEINACPVNGPAISSNGQGLAVAWFTAVREKPQAYAVLSTDGGETFGPPVRIDDGTAIGRVDIESLPNRDAFVTWVERTPQGAEIRGRIVKPNGAKTMPLLQFETNPARSSGFPRIAVSGDELVIAWTDSRNASKVRTAILKLTGN